MNTTTKEQAMDTTNRDAYLLDILDVFGPNAMRSVAEGLVDDHADAFIGLNGPERREQARTVVAGFIVDTERGYLTREPDYWDGVTTDEAHEIRASIIRDVADALDDAVSARADDEYEARMSCRRRTNDCGCRTCGG